MRIPGICAMALLCTALADCKSAGNAQIKSSDQSLPTSSDLSDATLLDARLIDLHGLMVAKKLTAERLATLYISRIKLLNEQGPSLHSVIATNPDLIDQARALDQSRKDGETLPPLWGIPVLLKDNIESKDRMATTGGSLALANNFALQDAPVVANLRKSGALILGKANMSEWAGMRGALGWSAVGGQSLNPYDPTASTCGSSAGSAVAVAARMAPVAVGTETSGSVICPS